MRILPQAIIPELPGLYRGKVRDCYDLPDRGEGPLRVLVATDRLSAFDQVLACIPFKGQVLTETARYWFNETAAICPNHVLHYPDANVVIGKRLTILPVEVIVRGYLAGTTGTSILTMYNKGVREMYGHRLPEGLRPNEVLPAPIITPTTKADDGAHDAPLTSEQIVSEGILPGPLWTKVQEVALALFALGQARAAERGLILADTKYEFGLDAEGNLLIADEIHTPDSSRYWLAEGYGAALEGGTRPPSFDKDVIRAWVSARCDPYNEPVPEIPVAMIEEASRTYIAAHDAITGRSFVPDLRGETPLERIRAALAPWFS